MNIEFCPNILILGVSDTVGAHLSHICQQQGFKTIQAKSAESARLVIEDMAIDVILWLSDELILDQDQWDSLREAAKPRLLPIIAFGKASNHTKGANARLAVDCMDAQIGLMIEQKMRECVAEEECILRAQTFKIAPFAAFSQNTKPAQTLRILAIGQPNPNYLALSSWLMSHKVELSAALTSYTAFDFLHDQNFDAVVLMSGTDLSESLSVASGMKRNTRLYHIPIALWGHFPASQQPSHDIFTRGIIDLLNEDATVDEVGGRLIEHALSYRRTLSLKEFLSEHRHHAGMDSETGLMGRTLFAEHLSRLVEANKHKNRALSVVIFKISDTDELIKLRAEGKLKQSLPQIGSMISRLIRADDTGGRLSNDIFALALPATSLIRARYVAERVSAVVACTAFDCGNGMPPIVIELETGIAELLHNENASDLLLRAAQLVPSSKILLKSATQQL